MEEQVAAYTVANFCKAYSVSPSLFYSEVRAGKLNPRKARGRTLISASEARRWFESLPLEKEKSAQPSDA